MDNKRELFAKEYLVDLNATQAAIRAGYSKKTANVQGARLLTKANVRQAIDANIEERSSKLDLNADWVLNNLRSVAERCLQAEPVVDREGNETGEYQFNAAGANKALELIGRHLRMFGDNLNVKVDHLHFIENMQSYGKMIDAKYKRIEG